MIKNETKKELSLVLDDILEYIFSDSILSELVIFKGGTALAKVYNLNRFSKDIDLSYIGPGYGNITYQIKDFIEGIGLTITSLSSNTIEFKVGELKSSIDISYLRDVIKKNVGQTNLISENGHRYFVRVMELDEILAEKVRAIVERKEGKDLWDAYKILERGTTCNLFEVNYKCKHSKEPFSFDKAEFARIINSWTEHRYVGQMQDFVKKEDIIPLKKLKIKLIEFTLSIH
ncbi:nucleotidyl transferase AbiEii/AbiGii toxin family protein [Candidatus Marsarchaeota archaeon]|jgi:predicted nucleotidyltransferase component of viral defense system|nr:nucleotidyl transferase AbiEii/AbiGii toxin family protein [Candidatus Marsarchaeota archaeon]MCL5090266.1 nucleotidyl transferase AbiEii/AbiGii toxin family protein [Candidatus Marsarchaeota archaeon]